MNSASKTPEYQSIVVVRIAIANQAILIALKHRLQIILKQFSACFIGWFVLIREKSSFSRASLFMCTGLTIENMPIIEQFLLSGLSLSRKGACAFKALAALTTLDAACSAKFQSL